VGLRPMLGSPLPTFSETFRSLTVLPPTMGLAGLADAPSGGVSAASGSYSAALLALNGNDAARSSMPATFSARMSPAPDASGRLGPLTVARALRTVPCFCFFDAAFRPDDLAMSTPRKGDKESRLILAEKQRQDSRRADAGSASRHERGDHELHEAAA